MRSTSPQSPPSTSWLDRRGFVIGAGAAGAALGSGLGVAYSQIANAPDYTLRIAPAKLELAPGKVIETFAYNGAVPGPVLAMATPNFPVARAYPSAACTAPCSWRTDTVSITPLVAMAS